MATAEIDVDRLAARARAEGRLGLDTEFMPEGRYHPLLCLVQIVVGDEIAVLDPLDGFDPAPLAAVLADPAVGIVLHAGRQDVAILRREWGTDVTSVFDTQVAAGFAGFSAQAGYTGLLHDVLHIRVAKTASFTRWDARPLTAEQLSYAREDVEHLLPLADEICSRLAGAAGWGGRARSAVHRRRLRRARPRRGVAPAAAHRRPRPARARAGARARRRGVSARPSARTGRSAPCCATPRSSSWPSGVRAEPPRPRRDPGRQPGRRASARAARSSRCSSAAARRSRSCSTTPSGSRPRRSTAPRSRSPRRWCGPGRRRPGSPTS